jgi:MinD superfamily P-loop ATPase
MKEIVVISGKGGTGKTSLTASFAVLGAADMVVADCDVDAADMHLLLDPDFGTREAFYSGEIAVINQDDCAACGRCFEVCRYGAVRVSDGTYEIDALSCEGCGYCARVCADQAITNVVQNVGDWYLSRLRTGANMVHARLRIGADNSGKLVAKVKNEARRVAQETDRVLILVDGSPGIGCPVVSSLSGAALVVLVTEPSQSGFHDLKRVYELVKKFGIKAGCIINKADLNHEVLTELRAFLAREEIANLGELPYDEGFSAAITNGRTIVEWDPLLKERLERCWLDIKELAASH